MALTVFFFSPTSFNFSENTVNAEAQLLVTNTVIFSDSDEPFDTGVFSVSGLSASDIVSVRNVGTGAGEIGVSGSDVTYGGVVFGTLSGGTGSTLNVTLNAASNSAAIEALVQNLTYASTNDHDGVAAGTVLDSTLTIALAAPTASFSQAITIGVTAQDDILELYLPAGTATHTEGAASVQIANGTNLQTTYTDTSWNGGTLTVYTVDQGGLTDPTDVIGIADNLVGSINTLGTQLRDGQTVFGTLSAAEGTTTGGTSLVITFNSNATTALVEQMFGAVQYHTTSDTPAAYRQAVVTLVNGLGVSSAGTVDLDVIATNDAPQLRNLDGDRVVFQQGFGPVSIDAAGTGTDNHGVTPLAMTLTDPDTADLSNGSLTVSVSAGGVAAEDVLGFDAGTVALSGGDALPDEGETVAVGGVVIGTIASAGDGRSGNDLIVTFNANATHARAETLVRAIQYENISSVPSTTPRTLNVTVDDGDGGSPAVQEITVAVQVPATAVFSDTGQSLGSGISYSSTLGDVDGDGDLDMVVTNADEANRLWLNDGSGTFFDSGQSLGSGNSYDSSLGDLDGDGDLDLVVANRASGNRVWLNDGGTFTDSGQSLDAALNSNSVALGDVDGDGDLDMVVANSAAGNTIWLNDGTGNFADSGQSLGDGTSWVHALGDVDGDGDLDIFVPNQSSGDKLWLNDGTGEFTDSGQNLGPAASRHSAFGDLDGDGDLDLVIGDRSGAHMILLNDGTGVFTDTAQGISEDVSLGVSLGDLDGDGDLDLMLSQENTENLVYFNDGNALFSLGFQTLDSGRSRSSTMGDLDGDGDLDIVVASNGASTVWINSQAPALSLADTPLAVIEDLPLTLIDINATLFDRDGDADWNGGTLVVQITANAEASDQLSVANNLLGAINTDGTDLRAGTTVIGTLSAAGGNVAGGTALTITFNASATNALVQQAARSLMIGTGSQDPDTSDRTVTITTTDAQGSLATATRTVQVTAIEDPTVLTGLPTDLTFVEETAGFLDFSGSTLSDLDARAGFTLTLSVDSGVLSSFSGNGVVASGSGTGTLTLTGQASAIDSFLNSAQAVQYTGDTNVSGEDAALLTLTANDGGADIPLGTVNLDITSTDDPTVLTGQPAFASFIEDTPGALDLSDITLGDADLNPGFSLTIGAGGGSFQAADGAGVTVTGTGGGPMTLTGLASAIDAYLNNPTAITYTSPADVFGFDVTLFSISTNDGAGDSSYPGIQVTIAGVEDPTGLTGLPTDRTFVEETSANLDLSAASLVDVDRNSGFTLTLSADSGTLTASDGTGVTVSGSGSGALVLTGLASAIDTYLNTASAIQYTGDTDVSGDDAALLTLTANDGGADIPLGTVNLDITGTNDLTILTGLPSDLGFSEETTADLDLSNVSLTDVDDNAAFTLTVSTNSGTLTASDGAGVTVTGSGSGALVLTGLASDIDAYLNTASALQYTGATDVTGDNAALLSLSANDGAGGEPLGTVNLDLLNVNDVPVATGLPTVLAVDEAVATPIDLSGVTLADRDGDVIIVTIAASTGLLEATTSGGVFAQFSGTGLLQLFGPVASLNTYLQDSGAVQYTGPQGVFGDAAASLTISANDYYDLTPLGTVTLNITDVVETQTGGPGPDSLTGTPGADILIGLGANDRLVGLQSADRLEGGAGADDLVGGDGNDTLIGGTENDQLNGGLGDDILNGGAGFDTAVFDGLTAATVNLGSMVMQDTGYGNDCLIGIQAITSGGGRDRLTGNSAANRLDGGAENDVLLGGAGSDSLVGGAGNDLLRGDGGDDVLNGGGGIDTALFQGAIDTVVNLGTSGAQATGHGNDVLVGIQNVTSGTGNDELFGNSAANVLVSKGGNNLLLGGAGGDRLVAGAGNDGLLGQGGVDSLVGGDGVDTLDGGAGADILDGGDDNDILRGGSGEDDLRGGLGRDFLTGGADADVFLFDSNAEAGIGAARDQILDFEQGGDMIDVSGMSADVFAFRGTAAFASSGNSEVRLIETATGTTIVQFDEDGDGSADAEIRVANVIGLTADDFIL